MVNWKYNHFLDRKRPLVQIAIVLIFLLCSFISFTVNLPAKVRVEPDQKLITANSPIDIIVSVTHLKEQKIEYNSFRIEGKPLAVTMIQEESPESRAFDEAVDPSSLLITKFKCTLPGKPPGLYILPPIEFRVGEQTIQSVAVTYSVVGPEKTNLLFLEGKIIENRNTFPGDHLFFQYKIFFKESVQLTKEDLPLLTMPGVQNIKAPQITDSQEKGFAVQTVTQEAIAKTPGEYASGPSTIQGLIYTKGPTGQVQYGSRLIYATTPSVSLKIQPFPGNAPPSFNGSLGIFRWQAFLKGSNRLNVNEPFQLELIATGSGNFDTVQLPNISAQDAFQNDFSFEPVPVNGVEEETRKRFTVTITPLNPLIREIPPIAFSSLDPISGQYVMSYTTPIPITISGVQKALPKEEKEQPENVQTVLEERTVTTSEKAYWVIAVISFFLFIGVQHLLRIKLRKKAQKQQSDQLLIQAIQEKATPSLSCKYIRESLLLALFEKKIISSPIQDPKELRKEGLEGDIRNFLLSIEEKRFSGLETSLEIKEIIDQASLLYHKLRLVHMVKK